MNYYALLALDVGVLFRLARLNQPKKARAATYPPQNALAVSAGYAFTNTASLCGRSTAKKKCLALLAVHDRPGISEVGLRMPRRMRQRHERLLQRQPPRLT